MEDRGAGQGLQTSELKVEGTRFPSAGRVDVCLLAWVDRPD